MVTRTKMKNSDNGHRDTPEERAELDREELSQQLAETSVTIKNGEVERMLSALLELSEMVIPMDLVFRVKEMHDQLQKRFEHIQEEVRKAQDQYAKKDANGKIASAIDRQGNPVISLVDPVAYTERVKQIYAVAFTIKGAISRQEIIDLGDGIKGRIVIGLGNLIIK